MKYILIIILGFIIPPVCWSKDQAKVTPLGAYEQSQIHSIVIKIKDAIIAQDTTELLKYISTEFGLSCTDTNYSYSQASKFLNNKNSHLFLSLFNAKGFSKLCGEEYSNEYPATSEKEILQSANELIMVSKNQDNWVTVTITSRDKNKFPLWWYLHKEGDTWKVTGGSFIIGRCSCGG